MNVLKLMGAVVAILTIIGLITAGGDDPTSQSAASPVVSNLIPSTQSATDTTDEWNKNANIEGLTTSSTDNNKPQIVVNENEVVSNPIESKQATQDIDIESSSNPIVKIEEKKEKKIEEATKEVYVPPTTTQSNFAKPSKLSGRSCHPRPTCGQIATCDDAYFYLNTCGYSGLDRDKDGVPCETICGGG